MESTQYTVAVIGAGLIGRSWSVAFANAGAAVRLYDPVKKSLEQAEEWLKKTTTAQDMTEDVLSQIKFCTVLEHAVEGVSHVQESTPELLDVKRKLFATLDQTVPPNVPIYSSTSALLPSELFKGLLSASRFLIAHPTNPPHIVPLVELVPSPWTQEGIISDAISFFEGIGQDVVLLRNEIPGFVLNRLQAALVNEALRLVAEGVAKPNEIDKVVSSGLGLRWAFIGPFETMDLNSKYGFAEYAERFKDSYITLDRFNSKSNAWNSENI